MALPNTITHAIEGTWRNKDCTETSKIHYNLDAILNLIKLLKIHIQDVFPVE